MVKLNSLCVYFGSRDKVDDAYRQAAIDLGQRLAAANITLVYGGGRIGLMGLCADACIENGGKVIGIIPEHLHDLEVGHHGVTELIITKDMHSRKSKMFELSDAFAILPGGLGTLDEAFEIITWRQLAIHDKPVILVNIKDYWKPFNQLIDHIIDEGFAADHQRNLFQTVATVDDIIPAVEAAPAAKIDPKAKFI